MEVSPGEKSGSASERVKELHLPVSRVKTIMKSSPEVEAVGPEPLFLVTKLTELFVADLAKQAYKLSKNKSVDYKDLANVVQDDDTLDFLREIMPCKITYREYKEIMAKRAARGEDVSSTDESEGSCEEEEEDQSAEEEEGDQKQESQSIESDTDDEQKVNGSYNKIGNTIVID